MDTSFGYQPDPEDNEIFFRRVHDDSSSDVELPRRTFMTRKTIAPTRCLSESDESEPNSPKNTSPQKASSNESSDVVFDPCWENFDKNSSTGTQKSNVTVVEEQPVPFMSNFENSSLVIRPSLSSDSILDSAFIDDGDISNVTAISHSVNNLNSNTTISENSSTDSRSEVFLSFDQPQRGEDDMSSRNSHVLHRIENRLNYFREKFNLQSSFEDQCSKNSCCHYQETNCSENGAKVTFEREAQFGDRTIAFVKEMKSATGNGKAGIPALMKTDPSSNVVKLKPMLNENESENIEQLFSTPVVMKHLRPLTLSATRRPNPNFQKGHHNLPSVSAINKITSQFSSSANSSEKNPTGVSSEPVVIKSALNFGSS